MARNLASVLLAFLGEDVLDYNGYPDCFANGSGLLCSNLLESKQRIFDMTEQETIEQSILGKRIVAVSWLPFALLDDTFELQSITLEGGTKLNLYVWITEDFEKIVVGEIEDNEDVRHLD